MKRGGGLPALTGDAVLELGYEVEVVTTLIPQFVASDRVEQLLAEPHVTRERVKVRVAKDGAAAYEITKLVPRRDVSVAHRVLADNREPIHRTVVAGGVLTTYDKSGRKIASTAIEHTNMPRIAEMLRDSALTDAGLRNTVLPGFQTRAFLGSDVLNIIEDGVIVSRDRNGPITIRVDGGTGQLPYMDGGYVLLVIDQHRSLLHAASLYDRNNVQTATMTVNYGEIPDDAEVARLTSMSQRYLKKLPSGRPVTVETLSSFENVQIQLF